MTKPCAMQLPPITDELLTTAMAQPKGMGRPGLVGAGFIPPEGLPSRVGDFSHHPNRSADFGEFSRVELAVDPPPSKEDGTFWNPLLFPLPWRWQGDFVLSVKATKLGVLRQKLVS